MVIVMDMSSGCCMDTAPEAYGSVEFVSNARRDPTPSTDNQVLTGAWYEVPQVEPRLALVGSSR